MDNLEEMDKSLERYNPKTEPGRNRKYERPITRTEVELVI